MASSSAARKFAPADVAATRADSSSVDVSPGGGVAARRWRSRSNAALFSSGVSPVALAAVSRSERGTAPLPRMCSMDAASVVCISDGSGETKKEPPNDVEGEIGDGVGDWMAFD